MFLMEFPQGEIERITIDKNWLITKLPHKYRESLYTTVYFLPYPIPSCCWTLMHLIKHLALCLAVAGHLLKLVLFKLPRNFLFSLYFFSNISNSIIRCLLMTLTSQLNRYSSEVSIYGFNSRIKMKLKFHS